MRILYLSLSYVPSRRASSVQVMKMCAALARRDHEVVLVAKQGDAAAGDDHDRYCVERSFTIDKVRRPVRRGGGVVYAAGVVARIARRRRWADLAYCRDPIGALLAVEAGLPVVFEAHGVPGSRWVRAGLARALRTARLVGVVAITAALRRDLIDAGIRPVGRSIVVAHDACDPPRREVVRRPLAAQPTIGYVGSLYPGRGIETIIALAGAMSTCRFRVVGGTEPDLAHWRASALPANLELIGFRPQADLPELYAGFDLVVMPHAARGVVGATGATDISRWTSPMKMFEYMASGVAMVASDLPVLREVLHDGDNALVAAPGDLGGWKAAIERALGDDELRYRLARTAQDDIVRHYTWDARAEAILVGLGFEQSGSVS